MANNLENFKFKKKFGQNFLSDVNLLKAIVSDAKVSENDNVLEIGTGAGALTEQICAVVTKGKVVSIEIDKTLIDFLTEKFKAQKNLELVFGDILKIDNKTIAEKFNNEPFRVVANLPYYISSPIIFYLIESELKVKSITIMLQKELVDRITASVGTKDYGALTVILNLYGKVKKTRNVPRTLFTPQPNVDSGVLNIELDPKVENIREVSKVVKACFMMRRKTLANNLMQNLGLNREQVQTILQEINLASDIRAERLSPQDFVKLTKKIGEIKNEK